MAQAYWRRRRDRKHNRMEKKKRHACDFTKPKLRRFYFLCQLDPEVLLNLDALPWLYFFVLGKPQPRLLVIWWQTEVWSSCLTPKILESFRTDTVPIQGCLEGLQILFSLGSSIFWVAGLLEFDSHELYLPDIIITYRQGERWQYQRDFSASPSLNSQLD